MKMQQRRKKATMALNRPRKGQLFTVRELEQGGGPLPRTTSGGRMRAGDSIFLPSDTCP